MILGRWVEYIDGIVECLEDTGTMESHEDREIVEPPPTTAKVEAAIEKLKNNMAPGMDFIQA
jgi:hypothetical protein